MRRGEVAGLAGDDVDLDAGWLRVTWTLGMVGNAPTWKPRPKSEAGERSMALDPATIEALRAWRRQQAEERLAIGPGWHDEQADALGQSRAGWCSRGPTGGCSPRNGSATGSAVT